MEAKKELGQNFLVDEGVVSDLTAAAQIKKTDTVLEVGAGTGAVTKRLAQTAGRVVAVEFDRDLIPTLEENLKGFSNLEIINTPILQL